MSPNLECLESRLCLSVVTNHGGPVLTAPQVSNLFIGSAASQQQAIDALTVVLDTSYAALLAPYGVGPGGFLESVAVPGPVAPESQAQILTLLTSEIQSGTLPAPTANSLYMIYVPWVLSDPQFQGGNVSAYHSTFSYAGQQVAYAVMFPSAAWESVLASHEFAEAATDPVAGTGWFAGDTLHEIADIAFAAGWQPVVFHGQLVTQLAGPDGNPLAGLVDDPPVPPVSSAPSLDLASLLAIPSEEFWALAYRLLATVDPRDFLGMAQTAEMQLQANDMLSTALGQEAVMIGEKAFLDALSQ